MNETRATPRGIPSGDGPLIDSGARYASFGSTIITWVRGAQDGDSEAMGWLARRYATPIFCFFRRRGMDKEDAKDLTGNVLVKLASGALLRRYDFACNSLRTYLLRVLANEQVSFWRHKYADKRYAGVLLDIDDFLEDAVPYLDDDVVNNEEEAYERQAAREKLNQAMQWAHQNCIDNGLEQHFGMFALRYLVAEPLSWGEIGEMYGINEDQARGRAATGKRRFQQALTDELLADAEPGVSIVDVVQELAVLFRHP